MDQYHQLGSIAGTQFGKNMVAMGFDSRIADREGEPSNYVAVKLLSRGNRWDRDKKKNPPLRRI
ncbi:hypothetical protein KDW_10340 [Dictyobacter vulcani]|uniref:Uncharacterized protein n=1 Tax=Dictyobacter vulcani TaxID=2607529 RepID=A0A5J4KIV5_9CHLR|nr:hypothetical protein KDW_10340 [Dictyobacter vulcani]